MFWDLLKPKNTAGKRPISVVPAIGGADTLTGGAAKVQGNLVELLSDAGNTSDCWVIGLYVYLPNQASERFDIALSREAAGNPPAAIEAVVPVYSPGTVADYRQMINLPDKVFYPAGTGIRASCADVAGGKTIHCDAIIIRGL